MNKLLTDVDFPQMEEMLENYRVEVANYGLNNGKMGLCLSYFLFSEQCHAERNQALGRQLFNEIYRELDQVTNPGFYTGISGIGWASTYLIQNGYVEVEDVDAFFCDFDDFLYKMAVLKMNDELSLDTGLTAYALYFYQRIGILSPLVFPYREVAHKECLVLTMNKISRIIGCWLHSLSGWEELEENRKRDLSCCFLVLYLIRTSTLSPKVTSEALYLLKCFFGTLLDSKPETPLGENDWFGVVCYTVIGEMARDVEMIQKSNAWRVKFAEQPSEALNPVLRCALYRFGFGGQAASPDYFSINEMLLRQLPQPSLSLLFCY